MHFFLWDIFWLDFLCCVFGQVRLRLRQFLIWKNYEVWSNLFFFSRILQLFCETLFATKRSRHLWLYNFYRRFLQTRFDWDYFRDDWRLRILRKIKSWMHLHNNRSPNLEQDPRTLEANVVWCISLVQYISLILAFLFTVQTYTMYFRLLVCIDTTVHYRWSIECNYSSYW